ncbi:hypothetical protein PGB90_009779 [Kerria lacca]
MSGILIKDPCGYICISFTYISIIYADYVVIKWIVLQTMQDRFHSVALILECILFGLFVILVLHDQLHSLSKNETLFEEYSNNKNLSAKHKILFLELCEKSNASRNIKNRLHDV